MTALLEVETLSVDLALGPGLMPGARHLDILADITLTMQPGETLGLVGESGSGKTTLARAILGLQRISGGTLQFQGQPLARPSDFAAIRPKTALMFHDAVASLSPRMRVGDAICEPFAINRQAIGDRSARAKELLAEVGLPPEIASRYPHELSGGQADLADEPTAGLDVSIQAEVLNLMADLRDRHGLAYLIISHNLALVRHVAQRIAVMYLGRLVETGPTAAVMAYPLHPYAKSLIAPNPAPIRVSAAAIWPSRARSHPSCAAPPVAPFTPAVPSPKAAAAPTPPLCAIWGTGARSGAILSETPNPEGDR
jgi:peptide/nickel transport system ATP-binding protein